MIYLYIYIIAYIYTITNAHKYLNSMIPWQDEISSPSGAIFHMPCSKIIPLVRWFSHFCTSTGKRHQISTHTHLYIYIFSNDIPIQTARVVNSHIIFQQFFRLTFPWKLHFRPAASCASPETRWASAGCCDPDGWYGWYGEAARQRGRTWESRRGLRLPPIGIQ